MCFFSLPVFVLVNLLTCELGEVTFSVCSQFVCRVTEAQSRPRREYTPKPRPVYDFGEVENSNGGYSPAANPPAYSAGKLSYVYFVIAV